MFIGFGPMSFLVFIYGVVALMSAGNGEEIGWGIFWIAAGILMWRVLWVSKRWWV